MASFRSQQERAAFNRKLAAFLVRRRPQLGGCRWLPLSPARPKIYPIVLALVF